MGPPACDREAGYIVERPGEGLFTLNLEMRQSHVCHYLALGHVRQAGVKSAVAGAHRQAAFSVMCKV